MIEQLGSHPSDADAPEPDADAGCSAARLPCRHCGLSTPCAVGVDPETVFCCNGCRGAYQLIQGWGLGSFYALRDSNTTSATPTAGSSEAALEVFDNDEFLGDSKPRPQSDGLYQTDLALLGLHCAACAWLIENVASQTAGWHAARVKLSDHTIRIVFDPQKLKLSEIARLLRRVGYELTPLSNDRNDAYQQQNRKLLMNIAVAGFCAANAMWIAIGLYAGEATWVAGEHRTFFRLIGTGLGIAAVLLPGRTFLVGALAALRTRTPHMDLPVALGLTVGSLAGLINVLQDRGEVYFDSLAVLVFLLLIGRWLQFHQQHRAARSVDLLLRITPRHAHRLAADGTVAVVLADRLRAGDTVRIAAGDSLPADGRITRGQSLVDRSLLTGESHPVRVVEGDEVEAGIVNLQSELDVEVTASGQDSRIGQVMQSVAEAAGERTPIVQLADRIGGVFVVVVSTLALLTFAAWLTVDWQTAASAATSLLIVACPCALALATPLAVAVAIGKSARQKIFIRDGSTFGQLAKPGTIWFDKTGTLTEGRLSARLLQGDRQTLALAAAVERGCQHPIAAAIIREAELHPPSGRVERQRGEGEVLPPPPPTAQSVTVEVGGVRGRYQGHSLAVGNLDFLTRQNVVIGAATEDAIERCLADGSSPILIAVDGVAAATLAVSDELKTDARAMIERWTQAGWEVGILSGDHPDIVDRIGHRLGLPAAACRGGLSPEDKLSIVRDSTAATTVMVGDGANDAAALAAADVGIAVRGGAEVSLRAAPVFVASGGLSALGRLVHAARNTTALIYTAFAVSLTYNLIAVGLAMAGLISPLVAAVLMPISSVSVLSLCFLWPIYSSSQRTAS
ncbi:heavy metal translocating P-type ATPase [Roseimaritima ulvae]|uniref:Copper-exporting P-type ATPase A n=1 Tax=Roseimaritima ulvae TaxID=980254 RepID=A0A5B9QKH3_9BACT|nr:heavy metal translocating P-type ATPase metal-binding domain-containing protein [Roseimaritima ulvae]QEG39568.1 Copper-exporting P-type ATPase A [Roseimaritima ulvae]